MPNRIYRSRQNLDEKVLRVRAQQAIICLQDAVCRGDRATKKSFEGNAAAQRLLRQCPTQDHSHTALTIRRLDLPAALCQAHAERN